ncbi:MAG: acyltransferase [Prevotella sp.]|nr:acyltransferase [Prevotella sp.]
MIQTLQSLRFVFMMMIFMSHFAYRDIRAFDAGGDCGVVFFFMLSGFLCSLGYGPRVSNGSFAYGTFLWNRFKKLYPLHLLCLLFFLLVSHAPLDGKVLLNVLLLQSWIPDADYYFSCNSVSWFLSSLMFCYAMFPVLYRSLSWQLTLAVAVFCVAAYWLTPADRINAVLYVNPVVRLADFYWGMLLYRFFEHDKRTLPVGWLEVLLVVLLAVSLFVYPFADAKLRNAPLYWAVLAPFIWVFARGEGFVSRWLKTAPMVFLGSFVLPVFLTHQLLIGILLHRLPAMPAVLMLAVCVFVVLTVSWGIQIIFARLFR